MIKTTNCQQLVIQYDTLGIQPSILALYNKHYVYIDKKENHMKLYAEGDTKLLTTYDSKWT